MKSFLLNGDLDNLRLHINSSHMNLVNSQNWSLLHFAAYYAAYEHVGRNNSGKLIRYLVTECGANLEAKTDHSTTPLHVAANHPSPATKVLLQLGADVNATDKNGNTPLSYCQFSPRTRTTPEFVWDLIDYGATVTSNAPIWVEWMFQGRDLARKVVLIFLGSQQFHRSKVLNINGRDTTVLIAKEIWNSRSSEKWQKC